MIGLQVPAGSWQQLSPPAHPPSATCALFWLSQPYRCPCHRGKKVPRALWGCCAAGGCPYSHLSSTIPSLIGIFWASCGLLESTKRPHPPPTAKHLRRGHVLSIFPASPAGSRPDVSDAARSSLFFSAHAFLLLLGGWGFMPGPIFPLSLPGSGCSSLPLLQRGLQPNPDGWLVSGRLFPQPSLPRTLPFLLRTGSAGFRQVKIDLQ